MSASLPRRARPTPPTCSGLINDVEYYMKDKVIVGSTVYAEPVDVNELWMNTYIRVLVHVTEGFNRTSVHQQVESVIRQALHFNAVDFGTSVTIGKVYRAALAVQGVEWCELMWLDTTEPTTCSGPGDVRRHGASRSTGQRSADQRVADPPHRTDRHRPTRGRGRLPTPSPRLSARTTACGSGRSEESQAHDPTNGGPRGTPIRRSPSSASASAQPLAATTSVPIPATGSRRISTRLSARSLRLILARCPLSL